MARSSEEVPSLVHRIYDAAVDPALWPDALVALTDAVGGSQVMMGIHDVSQGSAVVVAPRMDPAHLASYREHWGRGDILWQRTNRAPIGCVLHAERFAPREELVRTPFYNEWYRPLGLGTAGLGVNLFTDDGLPGVCGIKRSSERAEFSAEEVALFAAIVPHLVRAVEIQRRLQRASIACEAALTLGGPVQGGTLLADEAGRCVEANEVAQTILDAGDGLLLENGRLAGTNASTTARLRRLIAGCARPSISRKAAGGSLKIPRDRERPPLLIEIAPLDTGPRETEPDWLGLSSQLAVLTLTDPERQQALARESLRTRFDLTPAEANLAMEVARGDGRQAAAARAGISLGTARTHLSRIFDKLGVQRQAELVRLVLEVSGSPRE
ncbi:MAG: helix-turn-helix transcriptional regulator [Tistlia sp.]|uniref:helix-turn-helix transcriptional regulator n=1 Tax=Tistlia sp. TaxID=3057121 RepID=UPI0034A1C41B